jgi:hypothetical protein
VETFTEEMPLVGNPDFSRQREVHLARLDLDAIDQPIRDLISGFARLHHCYTLQSCFGHFLPGERGDPRNLDRLPRSGGTVTVRYRIAYVALCIANSAVGRVLLQDLRGVPAIDPEYVQFGSAEWFWARQVNAYALQVEPRRFRTRDEARVSYQEALHLQDVRDRFFTALEEVVSRQPT